MLQLDVNGQVPPAVPAVPAFPVTGGGQLVVVDLAGILAVGRGHDRDLLAPHVELEPRKPGHDDAHGGRHHFVRLTVPRLAPLRLRTVIHEVLELDALEPVEEVDAGGERRVAVDGVAPQSVGREEGRLLEDEARRHGTRRFLGQLVDDAREPAAALLRVGRNERERGGCAHEVRVDVVVLVARGIRHGGLDLPDQYVRGDAQPLRRHHRHLPRLHRADAEMEGAVADRRDHRERAHGEHELEKRESGAPISHFPAPPAGS